MTTTANLMHEYGFDQGQGLEFGIYSLGDHLPCPAAGTRVSAEERIHEFIGYAQAAEAAGIDVFSQIGRAHV